MTMQAKGLLVYATGKTEEVQPMGLVIVKVCDCCGSNLYFRSPEDGSYAVDMNTVEVGTPQGDKVRRPAEATGGGDRLNVGCVVYVQRKGPAG